MLAGTQPRTHPVHRMVASIGPDHPAGNKTWLIPGCCGVGLRGRQGLREGSGLRFRVVIHDPDIVCSMVAGPRAPCPRRIPRRRPGSAQPDGVRGDRAVVRGQEICGSVRGRVVHNHHGGGQDRSGGDAAEGGFEELPPVIGDNHGDDILGHLLAPVSVDRNFRPARTAASFQGSMNTRPKTLRG